MATLTQNVTTIVETFEDIKDAIETKGGTVSGGVGNYASAILDIPQSGGGGVIDASTDWGYIFANNKRLDIIGTQQLSSSHVTDMSYLCNNSTQLTGMAYPLNMTSCTNSSHMFYGCTGLISVNLSNSDSVQDADNMFDTCRALTFPSSTVLDLSSCTAAGAAFRYVGGGVLNIKLGSTVSGNDIFYSTGLTQIHILSDTIFTGPYRLCAASSSLTTVSGVNLSGVTTTYGNTYQPFYNCTALENLSFAENSTINTNFNVSTCTNLSTQSIWNILDALGATSTTKTCTLPTGKMPSISDLTTRYGSDFDTTTNKLKGWTLSPTPT